MKENYGKIVLGAALIIAATLVMTSCVSYAPTKHEAPCCESEVQITVDSLEATKCLTCGIHFTHPTYGEHIKTCCP